MAIGFDQIAITINTPGVFVEFDNSRAVQGLAAQPHDVLLTGQMLTGGSATPGQIYLVASDANAVTLFGAKSQLRQMIRRYKELDADTPVYACACAADSGTAATGSIDFTGTATEAGELPLYVHGQRVPVAVAIGDDAAALETAALAELAKYDDDLAVSYAASAGTGVDFTAEHQGTIGNQIFLGVALQPGEEVPAGISAVVTPMSAGATDPSYAGVITAMGEDQYHTVGLGIASDTVLDLFEAELESRWGPMRAIEGQCFAALYDAHADLLTAGSSRNSFSSTLVGAEESALLPLPWEVAAQTAAISAVQTKADPSRSTSGLSFRGFSAAPRGARYTRAQRDALLDGGISTVRAASDGRLVVERLITTWQTNAQSLPDRSYYDLFTVRLLARLRYDVRTRVASRFGRFKLANDGDPIPAGQPIATPALIRSEMISLFLDWRALGWVEDVEQFQSELLVERDLSDPNRVNMILPPNLVNNLLITAAKVSFIR